MRLRLLNCGALLGHNIVLGIAPTVREEQAMAKYWKETDSTEVREIKGIHDGEGVIRVRSFFRNKMTTGINMHVWELAPGASEGNHIHEGEHDGYEETYYFLQGRGVMWVEGEEIPIQAGDAFLVPPGVDHGFRNTGDEPLRLVLLFAMPRDEVKQV